MKFTKNYSICIFKNKKIVKRLFTSDIKSEITLIWDKLIKDEKPPYTIEYEGKRNMSVRYEIGFIIPSNFSSSSYFTVDDNGNGFQLYLPDKRFKVKKLLPYWREEKIYNFKTKKRISYDVFKNKILKIKEICQIFTLNKNIFIQTENDLLIYGNKNIHDSKRLLNILREDMIKEEKGNYIFVKDITTHQRKTLYNLLEDKGFDRKNLFRHYSY